MSIAVISIKKYYDFADKYLLPLYYDSLLLRRDDVRAYFRKKQIRQAVETDGLMFEDGAVFVAPVIFSPPQQPVAPKDAPALATETPSTSSTQPSAEPVSNTGVQVPRILWKGKRPSAVRDGMREEGYDDAVIAYVLHKWCGENDTYIGKLLHIPNGVDNDRGKTETACRRRSQRLKKKASAFTITTD